MKEFNKNGKRYVILEEECENNIPGVSNDSQDDKVKRQRAPNFSTEEKSLLLALIYDVRHIIENKKTDGITMREKERAWCSVMNSFNSQTPSRSHRAVESLKKFYENQKKVVRKEVAEKKTSASKTWGGPGDSSKANELTDLTLAVMNRKTVHGLENKLDSVGVREEKGEPERDKINIAISAADEPIEGLCDQLDWGDYTPAHLKTPVHSKLRRTETTPVVLEATGATEMSTKTPVALSSWTSRRRPITEQVHSSILSEQYGELATYKLELAKLELENLQKKTIVDEQREKILFDLKVQALELDIDSKKLDISLKNKQLGEI